MLTLFIVLTAVSFIAALGSGIWWIVRAGQVSTRSGPDVGAEVMAGLGEEEAEGDQIQLFGASGQVFKGTGVKAEGSAEMSFKELKRLLAAGEFGVALPPAMVAIGLVGTLLFGALALFIGLEDKLIGGLLAALGFFMVIRMVYDFFRA